MREVGQSADLRSRWIIGSAAPLGTAEQRRVIGGVSGRGGARARYCSVAAQAAPLGPESATVMG